MDMTQQLESIKQILENQQANLSDIATHTATYGASPWGDAQFDDANCDEEKLCTGSYFERIADIVNARRAAKNKMIKVYERDRYTFKQLKDPEVVLTEEQEKEIRDFWSPYEFAYKNDINTQRYYSAISGRFDPTYIGFGLQFYFLNRYWNHITVALLRNKNYLDLVFPQAKHPRTIVRNMWARYYTEDRTLISQQEAIQLVLKELKSPGVERLILKPDDGEEGKGIVFLKKGMSANDIKAAFAGMKEKFICQEVIRNHPTHAAPHPESLNTLRIATIFSKNEVRLVGVVWRMGVDKEVDNWSAGGIACGVSEDGVCHATAVDHVGNRVTHHPSGFKFEGHRLFHCKEAVDTAKKLHAAIPQLRYISWDFAINENGDPVMIEMNCCGGCNVLQMNGFPAYIDRETLKSVLDEHLLRRFHYDRVNWNWNYQEYNDHIVITKYAGRSAHVTLPATLRSKPVTGILDTVFAGKKITAITAPQSVADTCEAKLVAISKKLGATLLIK